MDKGKIGLILMGLAMAMATALAILGKLTTELSSFIGGVALFAGFLIFFSD